jgi:hypothetical protein
MCVMLSIGVAAFFLAYAHITHPGMPAFSQSLKSATIGTRPPAMPGYGHFDQPPLPLPDMDSPAVKLASADVLQVQNAFDSEAIQPRKSRIKTIAVPKHEQRGRSAKRQKAKPARVARINVRSQGRAYANR